MDGFDSDDLFMSEGTVDMLPVALVPLADMFNHTAPSRKAQAVADTHWVDRGVAERQQAGGGGAGGAAAAPRMGAAGSAVTSQSLGSAASSEVAVAVAAAGAPITGAGLAAGAPAAPSGNVLSSITMPDFSRMSLGSGGSSGGGSAGAGTEGATSSSTSLPSPPLYNPSSNKGFFQVVTSRAYPSAGEEVFISYGDRSSRDLLENYGFTLPSHANAYDSFSMSLTPFYFQGIMAVYGQDSEQKASEGGSSSGLSPAPPVPISPLTPSLQGALKGAAAEGVGAAPAGALFAAGGPAVAPPIPLSCCMQQFSRALDFRAIFCSKEKLRQRISAAAVAASSASSASPPSTAASSAAAAPTAVAAADVGTEHPSGAAPPSPPPSPAEDAEALKALLVPYAQIKTHLIEAFGNAEQLELTAEPVPALDTLMLLRVLALNLEEMDAAAGGAPPGAGEPLHLAAGVAAGATRDPAASSAASMSAFISAAVRKLRPEKFERPLSRDNEMRTLRLLVALVWQEMVHCSQQRQQLLLQQQQDEREKAEPSAKAAATGPSMGPAAGCFLHLHCPCMLDAAMASITHADLEKLRGETAGCSCKGAEAAAASSDASPSIARAQSGEDSQVTEDSLLPMTLEAASMAEAVLRLCLEREAQLECYLQGHLQQLKGAASAGEAATEEEALPWPDTAFSMAPSIAAAGHLSGGATSRFPRSSAVQHTRRRLLACSYRVSKYRILRAQLTYCLQHLRVAAGQTVGEAASPTALLHSAAEQDQLPTFSAVPSAPSALPSFALEVQAPWGQWLVTGRKQVETRKYSLQQALQGGLSASAQEGDGTAAPPGAASTAAASPPGRVTVAVVESPSGGFAKHGLQSGRLIGWVQLLCDSQLSNAGYGSREQWLQDKERHRVNPENPLFAWREAESRVDSSSAGRLAPELTPAGAAPGAAPATAAGVEARIFGWEVTAASAFSESQAAALTSAFNARVAGGLGGGADAGGSTGPQDGTERLAKSSSCCLLLQEHQRLFRSLFKL